MPAKVTAFRRVLDEHRGRLTRLSEQRGVAEVKRLYDDAVADLQRKLSDSVRAKRGDTFTAMQHRVLLTQAKEGQYTLAKKLVGHLGDVSGEARREALRGLSKDVSRLEKTYTGAEVVLPIEEAARFRKVYDGRTTSLVRLHMKSADELARRNIVGIEEQLGVSLATGESTSEAIDRVVALTGEQRWQAERIVRTECAWAFNATHADGIADAARELPDMMMRWTEQCDDASGAPLDDRVGVDSIALHGQLAKPGGVFTMPPTSLVPDKSGKTDVPLGLVGMMWAHPPNRPNDRAVLAPWRPHWGVPGWTWDGSGRVPYEVREAEPIVQAPVEPLEVQVPTEPVEPLVTPTPEDHIDAVSREVRLDIEDKKVEAEGQVEYWQVMVDQRRVAATEAEGRKAEVDARLAEGKFGVFGKKGWIEEQARLEAAVDEARERVKSAEQSLELKKWRVEDLKTDAKAVEESEYYKTKISYAKARETNLERWSSMPPDWQEMSQAGQEAFAAGTATPKQQRVIREELNRMAAANGLRSSDFDLPDARKITVDPTIPFGGFHNWDGAIVIRTPLSLKSELATAVSDGTVGKVKEAFRDDGFRNIVEQQNVLVKRSNAIGFPRSFEERKALDTLVMERRHLDDVLYDKYPDQREAVRKVTAAIESADTLVHEMLHGHSPIERGAYRGSARVVEEVSNSLATTSVIRNAVGVERGSPLEATFLNNAGYKKATEAVLTDVRSALTSSGVTLDEEQVRVLVEESSMDYKRDHRKIHTTPEDAVKGFSRKIAERAKLPEASHKAFIMKMGDSFVAAEQHL